MTGEREIGIGRMGFCGALPDWAAPEADGLAHVVGVLPGEGIGPEIIDSTLALLDAIERSTSARFDRRVGGEIRRSAGGKIAPGLSPAVADFCASVFADGGAMLCGPGGGRFVYDLRARFDLFCKMAPIRPLRALHDTGPLTARAREGVDVLIVRENTGGVYFGNWEKHTDPAGLERASHQWSYETREVARILRVAIRLAEMRRRRLTLVLKPWGLPTISELWSRELAKLTASTRLQTQILEVDNATYQLVAAAERFDVVVAPNLFGDILADCAGLLLGSRGMSFSGNFGANGIAVYQTGHGAALDLARSGRANPVGQMLSLAMMLRESFGLHGIAAGVELAIARALEAGWRTPDIAGPQSRIVGTRELGRRIEEEVEAALSEVPTDVL